MKTRNHSYDIIVGGRAIYWLLSHLANLSPSPKTQINRRPDATSFFPVGGIPTRKQRPEKDFSPKSQDAVALQQIKERGALPMIDRGDIRQAIDRCSNIYQGFTAGRWLWSVRA